MRHPKQDKVRKIRLCTAADGLDKCQGPATTQTQVIKLLVIKYGNASNHGITWLMNGLPGNKPRDRKSVRPHDAGGVAGTDQIGGPRTA